LVSKRLKSAEEPFAGLSAKILSLATWVEAVDFRGQVPYQLLLDFNYYKSCQMHNDEIATELTCLMLLASAFAGFTAEEDFSLDLESCLESWGAGVTGSAVVDGPASVGTSVVESTCDELTGCSSSGGFVLARLDRDGPMERTW
jgi:hypothetical protein